MCGRLNISNHPGITALVESLGIQCDFPAEACSFNAPPSKKWITIPAESKSIEWSTWGMTPDWSTSPITLTRAEKLYSSQFAKPLFENHRIIIPISGFYEWKRTTKTPYHFFSDQSPAFWVGGLLLPSPTGSNQFSIITTDASGQYQNVHHRMPVILPDNDSARAWLSTDSTQDLKSLIEPFEADWLVATRVSKYVNSTRNDGPDCIREDAGDLFGD